MIYIGQIEDDELVDMNLLCKVEASSKEEARKKIIAANPDINLIEANGVLLILSIDDLTEHFYNE